MRLLLNLIWLVLAGFWLAVGYAVAAVICFVLIVTIPFGLASFRLTTVSLRPFGRAIVSSEEAAAKGYPGGAFV